MVDVFDSDNMGAVEKTQRLHSTQQRSNNHLSKQHKDSLCVLARLIETRFGGVALEGMQELFKVSCKKVDKMTHYTTID